MRRPKFWNNLSLLVHILTPIGLFYNFISKQSYKLQKPYLSKAPVICVGSPIIGGGGKTPVVIAIQKLLLKRNKKISAISIGYRGTIKDPVIINKNHTSIEVGDEPLLLSQNSDTFVSKKRKDALVVANSYKDYDYILSDDGYRDSSIKNKINILVIDGNIRPINLKQFPAGDLLGSLDFVLNIADILILVDEEKVEKKLIKKIRNTKKNCITAKTEYLIRSNDNSKKIAFTGIGMPEKFFSTLKKLNIKTFQNLTYPNHYQYKRKDVKYLLEIANGHKIFRLLTTSKDYMRLNEVNDPNGQLREMIDVVDISIEINSTEELIRNISLASIG